MCRYRCSRGGGAERRGGRHQGIAKGLKEASVGSFGAVFGVPLHSDDEAFAGQLDRLDDAIGGGSGDLQARGEPADRLVMARVDGVLFDPQDGVQAAVGRDGDAVGSGISGLLVSVDVLGEGATEGDIEQLQAAADCEHGQIAIQGFAQEGGFEGIAAVVGGAGLGEGRRTVQDGVDVGSSGEEEAVEAGQGRGGLDRFDLDGGQGVAIGLAFGGGCADSKGQGDSGHGVAQGFDT